MAGPKRLFFFTTLSVFILFLSSCVNPSNRGSNSAPWAVTGPVGDVVYLTASGGAPMSFELEVTDNLAQTITNPGPFDPDGDTVTFQENLEDINFKEVGGVQVLPIVDITVTGVFNISADTDLAGLSAQYTVSLSDGLISTPYNGAGNISLFFL